MRSAHQEDAMSEPADIVPFSSEDSPLPPELEYMLETVPEDQRKAVADAFYRGAQGDPESFPVAFTVQVQTLVALLKAYPERFRRRVMPDLAAVAKAIQDGQAGVAEAAKATAAAAEMFSGHAGELLQSIKAQHIALNATLMDDRDAVKAFKEDMAGQVT